MLETNGFDIIPSLFTAEEIAYLRFAISTGNLETHGARNLLRRVPAIREVAICSKLLKLVEDVVGSNPFPVRGIFFDKTPEANWKVAWHQDLTIAVTEKKDVPGFGPWSVKEGVVHVQPPISVLEKMLTVRIHLDECGGDNGPLQVIPGSHLHGRLEPAVIATWKRKGPIISCIAPEGGVLLMRPLLLHSSSSAKTPGHRRVVHIEYAAEKLVGELEWAEPFGRQQSSV